MILLSCLCLQKPESLDKLDLIRRTYEGKRVSLMELAVVYGIYMTVSSLLPSNVWKAA